MNIEIENKQELVNLPEEFFFKICSFVIEEEKWDPNVEISFLLINNEEMKELNFKYRNIDKATDVLSFAMEEDDDGPVCPGMVTLLGDIVISTEQAIIQAKEHNHSVEREIAFLTIHGMLHLLGYNHVEDDEAVVMEGKEKDYLQRVMA